MLATLTSSGSAAGLDPDRARRELALDPPGDDLVLARGPCRCAGAARRGGRRPPGSALRRVEPASATVATPAPRRRTSSSGLAPMKAASGDADAEAEAGGKQLAQGAEERGRVVGGRRLDRDLAGEHDLLELAGADPLRSPRRPRPRRRRGGVTLAIRRSPGRAGVEQRQRLLAQRREPALEPRTSRGRRRPRRRRSRSASARCCRRARSSESSGSTSSAGGNEDQCGAAPPSAAKAKPPAQTGPAPAGRPLGLVGEPAAHHRRRTRATRSAKRSAPRETTSWRRAERRRARSRRGRAAPSRTSGRRPAARRTRPRTGRAISTGDGDAEQAPPARAAARASGSQRRRARPVAVEHPLGPSARAATW